MEVDNVDHGFKVHGSVYGFCVLALGIKVK